MERRLQVLIDEERHRRISSVAAERGVSIATVVREALDRGLPSTESRRTAAGRRVLEAEPMAVPEVEELLGELDGLRSRRS